MILRITRMFEKHLLDREVPYLAGNKFREHAKELEEMVGLFESIPSEDLRRELMLAGVGVEDLGD